MPISDLIRAPRGELGMRVPWEHRPSEQNQQRICIVDDDEWVADSLKSLLETFGYDVRSYNSGADFLADDRRRATACLIIDQHMPGRPSAKRRSPSPDDP